MDQIHSYLKEVADDMQNDRIKLEEYTITKGLTKAPEEYSDAKSQPHVQVGPCKLSSCKRHSGPVANFVPALARTHACFVVRTCLIWCEKWDVNLTAGAMSLARRRSA